MTPQDKLLEILACPRCKGSLARRPEGSSLRCRQCTAVYDIRDGLPIMLVDEADPRADGNKPFAPSPDAH